MELAEDTEVPNSSTSCTARNLLFFYSFLNAHIALIGGGGAGGLLSGFFSDSSFFFDIDNAVTVGAGGFGGVNMAAGTQGQNSSFGSNIVAFGGIFIV